MFVSFTGADGCIVYISVLLGIYSIEKRMHTSKPSSRPTVRIEFLPCSG
jgi:hypothetical protein